MGEARGLAPARRHRSYPAAPCPSRRPVSATPGGWTLSQAQETGQHALYLTLPTGPEESHVPGMTQTWRWRRGSARCRGRQRSQGGCSPGCAPATRQGFSGQEQGGLPAHIALAACSLQGPPSSQPLEETTFFLPCPLLSSPTSKNWLVPNFSLLLPSPLFHSDPPPLRFLFPLT